MYRTFNYHCRGYSHVKKNAGCEDFSDSYVAPDGRYAICVVCDGHSDSNCFRSGKGAEFGCKAAITILKRFFEQYYEAGADKVTVNDIDALRLKKGIKQYWDDCVFNHLNNNPITEDEKNTVGKQTWAVYEPAIQKSARVLLNIYGATFLAVGLSEDIGIAMHIGDGEMFFVGENGKYDQPLGSDDNCPMGSTASLCDEDLFVRESAFRCQIFTNVPQAVVVSSDGIGASIDTLQFKEDISSLIKKFDAENDENANEPGLNEKQKQYLREYVEHFSQKGVGAEDDCSLAGCYLIGKPFPDVVIPEEEAIRLLEDAIRDRNRIVEEYELRKERALNDIIANHLPDWINARERMKGRREVLATIDSNEKKKVSVCDMRINDCLKYFMDDRKEAVLQRINEKLEKVTDLTEDSDYRYLVNEYDSYIARTSQGKADDVQKDDVNAIQPSEKSDESEEVREQSVYTADLKIQSEEISEKEEPDSGVTEESDEGVKKKTVRVLENIKKI